MTKFGGRLLAIAPTAALVIAVVVFTEGQGISSTYSDTIVADTPIAYWPLDDSASTVVDLVGSHGGVLAGGVNSALFGPPTFPRVMHFDGLPCSGVVIQGDPVELAPTNGMTLEAWIRSDIGGGGVIFRWRHDGYLFAGRPGAGGHYPFFSFFVFPPSVEDDFTAAAGVGADLNIDDGLWHYLTVTQYPYPYPDGIGTKIYVDGTWMTGLGTGGPIYYAPDPVGEVAIGRDGNACDGVHPSWSGYIGQVALYSRPLDDQTIARHYVAGTSPIYPACGNQVLDPHEQCDDGPSHNGTVDSCCTKNCTFQPKGTPCTGGVCMGKADICTPVPACATTGFPDANRDHVDDNCEAGWRLSCVAGTWRDGNSQGPSLGAIFPGLALDGLEAAADVALPGVGGFLVQGGELVADFLDSASSMPPIFASSQVVPNYARAQVVYTKDANGKVAALRYLKLQATKVPSPTGGKQRVVAAVRIWDLYNPATVYFQSKVTKFGVYVETPGVDVMVPAKVIRLPAGGIPLPVDAWPVMTLMTRFDEGMNSRDPWCATSSLLGFYPVLTRDLAPQFANAESYLTPYIASEIRNPSYYSDGTTLYYPFYYSKPLSWYSFANYLKDLTLNDGNIQAVDTGDKHICLHMGADLSHSWDIGCDANPMFCAGTCDLAHQQCTNSLGTGCTSDPDCDFGECLPVNVAYAERFWPPIYPQNRLYACDASNLVRDPPYSRVADPFPNPADPLNPSDVPMVKQCIVDKDYSDAASITADRFSPVGAHAWYSVPEGTPPDPPDALIYYVYASPPLLADPNEADTLGLQYSTTWLPAGNGW